MSRSNGTYHMSRSKKPLRFGIRLQMMLVILLLFLAGGGILYGGIHARLWQSLESQITRELQSRQENSLIYIRQLLMLANANNDEDGYRQIAENIVQELRILGGRSLCVLDTQGQYISGNQQILLEGNGEDLRQAVAGNAAFTMTYPDSDTMLVYFSMPVVIEEHTLGIIRYRMDTSQLYTQISQNERLVYQTTAFVFALIFLLLAFFINQLLVPVWKLTEITRQVVRDLSREQVDMQMLAQLADSGRRDEVGELSRNFSVMLETIGTQLTKMQKDKEQIVSLLGSRQEFYNNMTHELKTPLTTIQGYAQLMEEDQGADRQLTKQGLSQILQESTRMHQMVLQLLEMSDKSIYMEKRPVNLAALARNVAQALEIKAARYEMGIETSLPEELWTYGGGQAAPGPHQSGGQRHQIRRQPGQHPHQRHGAERLRVAVRPQPGQRAGPPGTGADLRALLSGGQGLLQGTGQLRPWAFHLPENHGGTRWSHRREKQAPVPDRILYPIARSRLFPTAPGRKEGSAPCTQEAGTEKRTSPSLK